MDTILVSQDRELYTLCREILGELAGSRQSWSLSQVPVMDVPLHADLHIWDVPRNFAILDQVDLCPSRHLFLLDRSEVADFRKDPRLAEMSVLLKPVARATLAAFVAAALANRGGDAGLPEERDEFLQCLIQTNWKLQEYDQDRTNFLGRAVHDFRTPLTALSGYCGLLLSDALAPITEGQRQVLRRMHDSARRLNRMASAMLDLGVNRQTKRRPKLQKTDIGDCLGRALREVAPFADEKGLSIAPDLQPPGDELYLAPDLMEQGLINLLEMGCKFAPENGAIEIRGYPYLWERRVSQSPAFRPDRRVRAIREPNGYRVDIRDSGPPIAEEHLHAIFDEHTSYTGGRDRSGGGLGLAICRMIIARHDGRIWAENTALGPQFSFVLPLRRPDPDGDNHQGQRPEAL